MALSQSQDALGAKTLAQSISVSEIPLDEEKIDDIWDEERLQQALRQLREMHIQLRGLRTTIPRLIAPLTTKQPSPTSLYQGLSASASNANAEVREFGRMMTDEESRKTLEYARKSRARNPDGIKSWKVTEHPDWLTRDS